MRRTLAVVIAAAFAFAPAGALAQSAATVATPTPNGGIVPAPPSATPVEIGVQLGPAEKEGAEIIISARLEGPFDVCGS